MSLYGQLERGGEAEGCRDLAGGHGCWETEERGADGWRKGEEMAGEPCVAVREREGKKVGPRGGIGSPGSKGRRG
jgi:hypothetical protein